MRRSPERWSVSSPRRRPGAGHRDRFGSSLYVVNADPISPAPDVEYDIVRLPL
jgi:hypothetical protein